MSYKGVQNTVFYIYIFYCAFKEYKKKQYDDHYKCIEILQNLTKPQNNFKDIINPHICLLKNVNFSVKTTND